MIILRQRLYTFARDKMWRELHAATNGYRRLPKRWGNMTGRDFYRLEDIASGIYNRNVNPEDVRILATHLGLPITAKEGAKAINHYTNPELIERFKSIQAHKLGLGNEWKELQELRKSYRELEEHGTKAQRSRWNKKYRKRLEKLEEITSDAFFNNTVDYNKFKNFENRQLTGMRRANDALRQTNYEDVDLSNKMAHYVKDNYGVKQIYLDPSISGGLSDRVTGEVFLNPQSTYNPGVIGHEGGHIKAAKSRMVRRGAKDLNSLSGSTGEYYFEGTNVLVNPSAELADEAISSARGVSAGNAIGMTPIQRRRMILNNAAGFKSYYHKTIKDTNRRFISDLVY